MCMVKEIRAERDGIDAIAKKLKAARLWAFGRSSHGIRIKARNPRCWRGNITNVTDERGVGACVLEESISHIE